MNAKYYDVIGDHAVNVAEWAKYSITGSQPKLGACRKTYWQLLTNIKKTPPASFFIGCFSGQGRRPSRFPRGVGRA
jgi:hypothetical protein